MKHAEKKCRKIKAGRIPFSPEAAKWIQRIQVYKSLLRFIQKGRGNRGNLRRAAYRAGIHDPFRLHEEDIRARIEVCKEHCTYYRQHGRQYQRQHLQERLEVAREQDNEEAEQQILGIIKRERERAFWRRLKYSMATKNGGCVQVVQVEDGEGNVEVLSTKEEVHEAIWSNINRKQFYLAEEAPICNGAMQEEFGYNAEMASGDEVLDGSYWYEPEFDGATRKIFEELARSEIIRHGEWGKFWSRAREETSSSESGLHFSHYKARAKSALISHYHATKASVTLRTGFGLEQWAQGLSVMLEKVPGVRLIDKLRSILLMEADFNCINKIIYGMRMLNNVRKYDFMPDEIFSELNRTSEEGSLTKVLFYDIARQTRLSAGISSVDADNCYDRVSHAICLPFIWSIKRGNGSNAENNSRDEVFCAHSIRRFKGLCGLSDKCEDSRPLSMEWSGAGWLGSGEHRNLAGLAGNVGCVVSAGFVPIADNADMLAMCRRHVVMVVGDMTCTLAKLNAMPSATCRVSATCRQHLGVRT